MRPEQILSQTVFGTRKAYLKETFDHLNPYQALFTLRVVVVQYRDFKFEGQNFK
jgi:hypothetical protein